MKWLLILAGVAILALPTLTPGMAVAAFVLIVAAAFVDGAGRRDG